MKTEFPFVVGLDIGVSSIGWAAVVRPDLDAENPRILGAGVRIVPLTVDENTNFPKGKAITTTKDRTMKRTARRNLHRYRLRRHKLVKKLKEVGMLPTDELFGLSAVALYGLREKALREQLSLEEIGRILLHLNQKRGYKSSRKAQNEEEKGTGAEQNDEKPKNKTAKNDKTEQPKEKGYLEKIADREKALKDKGLTIGQHFYQQFLENPLFQTKNEIYLRDTYKAEFNKIWKFQAQFYPQILTEKLRKEIGEEVIYYQRRLKSQKHLVSWCSYEPTKEIVGKSGKKITTGYKTAPRSSPLFQEFVVWQQVNNIIVKEMLNEADTDRDFVEHRLTINQKRQLVEELRNVEELPAEDCLILLGFVDTIKSTFSLNFKKLQGYKTLYDLKKILSANPQYETFLQFQLAEIEVVNAKTRKVSQEISPAFEQEPLYKLWHLLYATEDEIDLRMLLGEEILGRKNKHLYNFDKTTIDNLLKIEVTKGGFANVSAKAIRKLLPFMYRGDLLHEAVEKAGYQEIVPELVDKLKPLKKGELKNPVVEKILNQVIRLVNEIIQQYGKPTEIRIELARELRMNAKKRKATEERNNARNKQRKEHEKKIREFYPHLRQISKKLLQRYELALQQNWLCPYTGETINIKRLHDDTEYDIDHILPKVFFYDNSMVNLVLTKASANRAKGDRTAYDYMASLGRTALAEYRQRIKGNTIKKGKKTKGKSKETGGMVTVGFPKTKAERLLMRGEQIAKDEYLSQFINRHLADTQYIGRELKKILQAICKKDDITSTTGGVTDWLREKWDLNAVFQKTEQGKIAKDLRGKPIRLREDLLMEIRQELYPQLKNEEGLATELPTGEDEREEAEETDVIKKDNKDNALPKNRDDHRHHLLDAIVIAFTEQWHIQQLNNLHQYYGNLKEKAIHFKVPAPPIKEFRVEVKKVLQKTLVSYSKPKDVGSWRKNKLPNSAKTPNEKRQVNAFTPKKELHEESLYGTVWVTLKAEHLTKDMDKIADERIRLLLQERKDLYPRNTEKVLESLKTNPIWLDEAQTQALSKVPLITRRYNLQKEILACKKLKNVEDFIQSIVDKGVREKVEERLRAYDNNYKEAFVDLDKNPIYLETKPNKKRRNNRTKPKEMTQITIKTVKCFTGSTRVVPLYDRVENPKFSPYLLEKTTSPTYVILGSNEVISLYRDGNGEVQEVVLPFIAAAMREKYKLPMVIRNVEEFYRQLAAVKTLPTTYKDIRWAAMYLPQADWQLLMSLRKGEMLVVGLSNVALRKALEENNYSLISQYLYRVQNIAANQYGLKRHTEAKANKLQGAMITLRKSSNWAEIHKVKIDDLGRISLDLE